MEIESKKLKMQMQSEAEERKMKIEAEIAERRFKLEAEEKARQREYDLQVRTLRGKLGETEETLDGEKFRLASAIKFVPKFSELDVENYLVSFEKIMAIHKFPKDKWTALMHTQLTGKAQKVFAELSIEDCQNYDVLKQALLTAYARVPEFYRKRFRTMEKGHLETYSNFAFRLSLPFKSWLEGEKAFEDVDKAFEVFKLEQFVNCLPLELHRWVVEKHPKTLMEAAKLADEFAILYKPFKVESFGESMSDMRVEWEQNSNQNSPTNLNSNGRKSPTVRRKPAFPKEFSSGPPCGFCGRKGHFFGNCFARRDRQNALSSAANVNQVDASPVELVSHVVTEHTVSLDGSEVHRKYLPFCESGLVYDCGGSRREVVMLRDTGALQSLVSKECLNACEFRETGEDRLIQGVVGKAVQVPLVEVRVQGHLVSGVIRCGLVDKLPSGIDFLIGNDLVSVEEPINVSVIDCAQAAGIGDTKEVHTEAVNAHDPLVCTDDDDFGAFGLGELFLESSDLKSPMDELRSDVGDIVASDVLIRIQRDDFVTRNELSCVQGKDFLLILECDELSNTIVFSEDLFKKVDLVQTNVNNDCDSNHSVVCFSVHEVFVDSTMCLVKGESEELTVADHELVFRTHVLFLSTSIQEVVVVVIDGGRFQIDLDLEDLRLFLKDWLDGSVRVDVDINLMVDGNWNTWCVWKTQKSGRPFNPGGCCLLWICLVWLVSSHTDEEWVAVAWSQVEFSECMLMTIVSIVHTSDCHYDKCWVQHKWLFVFKESDVFFLVQRIAWLTHCVHLDYGSTEALLNDVMSRVVNEVNCTPVWQTLQEDMIVSHVYWTFECILEMDNAGERLNVCQMTGVHDCDMFSLEWIEFSSDVVDVCVNNCNESELCVGVSLQSVDNREFLIGSRRRRRRRCPERCSRTANIGVALLVVLAALLTFGWHSSVGLCCSSEFRGRIAHEAMRLVLALRGFSGYFGSSSELVYSVHGPLKFLDSMFTANQKLLRWRVRRLRVSLNIRHRPICLDLFTDFSLSGFFR